MHKAELIERLANKLQTSKSQAGRVLDGTLEIITEAMLQGSDVQLRGFGTFKHKTLAARQGRLPSGKVIQIGERKTLGFTASKAILDQL